MSKDFKNLAARAAPAIFVVLWSTGFVATKYVLRERRAADLSRHPHGPWWLC